MNQDSSQAIQDPDGEQIFQKGRTNQPPNHQLFLYTILQLWYLADYFIETTSKTATIVYIGKSFPKNLWQTNFFHPTTQISIQSSTY